MRTRALPDIEPAVAFTSPACGTARAAALNLPAAPTAPFKPCTAHVTASPFTGRPWLLNMRTWNCTESPGFNTSSVGQTCTCAAPPDTGEGSTGAGEGTGASDFLPMQYS